MTPAFLTTVFCDDVRNEIGNKLSFMGIYGPNILLNEFPAVLPRFCVVMSLQLPAETQSDAVTFCLYKDDQEIGRAEASISEARKTAPTVPDSDEERRLTIRFIAQMTSLQLDGPCRLKARAEVDGETIKGGSLIVEKIPAGFVP